MYEFNEESLNENEEIIQEVIEVEVDNDESFDVDGSDDVHNQSDEIESNFDFDFFQMIFL